jgi:hypothetical protein|tara:strand:+ start:2342 stop:2992 length:651 start_codon:yes stop_codon:yes gene_type:complete
MANQPWHAFRHLHLSAFKAITTQFSTYTGAGGSFVDDPFAIPAASLPSVPTTFVDLDSLTDALPTNGDFYGVEQRADNMSGQRKTPWVEVVYHDWTNPGDVFRRDQQTLLAQVAIEVRCRVAVSHDEFGADGAAFVAQGRALWLADCCATIVAEDTTPQAASFDSTDRWGVSFTKLRHPAVLRHDAHVRSDTQDITLFDARARVDILQEIRTSIRA